MVKRIFKGTINILAVKWNKQVPGIAFPGETETS